MAKIVEEQHHERAVFVGVIKQGDDERQIILDGCLMNYYAERMKEND